MSPAESRFLSLREKIEETPVQDLIRELPLLSQQEHRCVEVTLTLFQALREKIDSPEKTITPLKSRASYKEAYEIDLPASFPDRDLQHARKMDFYKGNLCIHFNKRKDQLAGSGSRSRAKKVGVFSVDEAGKLHFSFLVQTSTPMHEVTPEFLHALNCLSNSSSPHLLSVLRFREKSGKRENKLHILLPYCPPPSTLFERLTLSDYVKGNRQLRLTNKEIVQLFEDLLSAVVELHEMGILHRDLHPRNIFIKDGHFFLGDFSESHQIGEEEEFEGNEYEDCRLILPQSTFYSPEPRSELHAVAHIITEVIIHSLDLSPHSNIRALDDIQIQISRHFTKGKGSKRLTRKIIKLCRKVLKDHPLSPLLPLLEDLFSEAPPSGPEALKHLKGLLLKIRQAPLDQEMPIDQCEQKEGDSIESDIED